jgi:hypothetical protein
MVFNATFNNISAISWLSVLLVEETPEYTKKTTGPPQVTVSSTSRHERNSNSIIIKIKNNKSTTHISIVNFSVGSGT